MAQLFSRIGSLSVKPPNGGLVREFKGLRFTFNIEKTSEPNPNFGKFSIFNLNEESRSSLEAKDSEITCRAGYAGVGVNTIESGFLFGKDLAEILFIGQIQKNGIKTERIGPDIITHLECATALSKVRDSTINKSFSPGTTAITVIKEVASSMGLNISQLQTTGTETFLNGISLSGASKTVLTNVLNRLGVQWSIQDDELHIVEPDKPTAEPAVLISSSTGLIGIPTKRQDGSIVFVSLLNPKLRPNRAIILDTSTITGNFRARKVVHNGDFDGGPFDSQVEATEIK